MIVNFGCLVQLVGRFPNFVVNEADQINMCSRNLKKLRNNHQKDQALWQGFLRLHSECDSRTDIFKTEAIHSEILSTFLIHSQSPVLSRHY